MKLNSQLRKKYGSMPVFLKVDGPVTGFELEDRVGI